MKLDSGKIGMELGEELRLEIPILEYERIKQALPKAKFVPSSVFWDLRTVKSPVEAEKIRKAAEITGKTFERFFPRARPEMTAREAISFYSIVTWSAVPKGRHSVHF